MGEIKSSMSAAQSMSAALKQGAAGLSKQTAQYATESNIAAVPNGQAAHATESSAVAGYKAALSSDANNLLAIGYKFESFDKMLSNVFK